MPENDFTHLETWAGALLAKLSPVERRKITRDIAIHLRRSQHQRISQQRNPDGSAFLPRKRTLRSKAGRIKRVAMFRKMSKTRYLKIKATTVGAEVGFYGDIARIARVHQEGQEDAVRPGGPRVRYAQRRLLGFTEADRERIRDQLLAHLVRD